MKARLARVSGRLVIFFGLASALGAQSADSSVLRRHPISMFGLPGLIQVPIAAAMPSGTVEMTFDRGRTPSVMPSLLRQANAFMAFGFLPRLTVSARATLAPFDTGSGIRRDVSANAQLLVLKEGRSVPAVALGVQDVGQGATPYFSSRYVVASKVLFDKALVSVGYGSGAKFLSGPFGGIGVGLGSWATALGEYDGQGVSGGVRVFPFPSIADRLGVQPRIDVVRGRETGTVVGVGLRTTIGDRGAAHAPTPRSPTWNQLAPPPPRRASARTPDVQSAPRPDFVVATERRLASLGFENVRVSVQGSDAAPVVSVDYENRRFNRDELDALGVVMGVTAMNAPPSVPRMRVTIRRVDVPVMSVESDVKAFVAFVNDRAPAWSFAGQLTFLDTPAARASAEGAPAGANPSRWKVDFFMRPRVETQVMTDLGTFEYRMTAAADAYVQVAPGLVLNGRRGLAETHSQRFWEAIDDPNSDRLLLHQALPLPLPVRWARANALTQFSVGRFEHEAVGFANETDISLADGRVSVGSMVAVFGKTVGSPDHTEALGTLRVRNARFDLTGSLTAGRFRKGDSGVAAELGRRFGATELAFYLRATEFAKVAGIKFAVPLTPSRELAPGRLRPRAPDVYAQTLQSQVFDPIPYLRRDVGRVLETDHDLARVYRTRDRLQPATVVAHVSALRDAARRWLGSALIAR